MKAIVCCTLFATSLIIISAVFALIPGFKTLPAFLMLGLPLLLAWLVAAGLGQNLVSGKKSLALATVCLIVAVPLVCFKPWDRGTGWQPDSEEVPENVPEGYVAFRFVSSFTYVSSPTNETITGVELLLPWPYIDAWENGRPCPKPVGLDNWLVKTDVSIPLFHSPMQDWLRQVWKLENAEPMHDNFYWIENAVWTVNLPLPGLPYTEIDFEPSLKLYFNSQLQWQDGQIIELLGRRTVTPAITAYVEHFAPPGIFQKIRIKLSDMYPGETVSIEGTFLLAEMNASNIRLDDYISAKAYQLIGLGQGENAPCIDISESVMQNVRNGSAVVSVLAQLEQQVNNNFVLLVRYEETWPG
ncbi:MAG: hypothetical protein QMD10_12330, partial [Desulfitobacteriaceae bacterium]|nr:hypothetical protein [Desulfitobacteriaceae bacterium]